MSYIQTGGGGGGGGGGMSGWLQVAGSPGDTHTTPINAPGGSNQNGPDILMYPGNGDGSGNAGNIVFRLASGNMAVDPQGIPKTGVVELDGTNQASTFNMVQPYAVSPNAPQNLSIFSGNGDTAGGNLNFTSGSAVNNTGNAGSIAFTGGNGGLGGSMTFLGGFGNAGLGGSFNASGGSDTAGGGGQCNFASGSGGPNGGGRMLFVTGSGVSGGSSGGDLIFLFGSGDVGFGGRNGLFFPNLPTSNPGVSGAMWNSGGTVMIS